MKIAFGMYDVSPKKWASQEQEQQGGGGGEQGGSEGGQQQEQPQTRSALVTAEGFSFNENQDGKMVATDSYKWSMADDYYFAPSDKSSEIALERWFAHYLGVIEGPGGGQAYWYTRFKRDNLRQAWPTEPHEEGLMTKRG